MRIARILSHLEIDNSSVLARLVEDPAPGALLTDLGGTVLAANAALCSGLALERAELRGRRCTSLFGIDGRWSLEAALSRAANRAQEEVGRGVLRAVDGADYEARWSVYPLRDRRGQVVLLLLLCELPEPGAPRGLLTMCAYCRRLRDEAGNWLHPEVYIQTRHRSVLTHGVCAECEIEMIAASPPRDAPGARVPCPQARRGEPQRSPLDEEG